jgi:hypothetical protein
MLPGPLRIGRAGGCQNLDTPDFFAEFAIFLLTNVTWVTILTPGASTLDNEMTPSRCSFLRALHD